MGRERGNAMKYNKEFESKERTTDYSGWLEQELKECREWMSSLIISSYMTDNIKDDFLTKGKQLLKGGE